MGKLTKETCSFCGHGRKDVKKLIAGRNGCICDSCIAASRKVLEAWRSEHAPTAPPVLAPALKPRDIRAALDRWVVGQDRAKKLLSVAVYSHLKRVACAGGPVELSKGNILLVGPTGTGKTLLAQALAKTLDVPLAIADAAPLTQAGYVGEDADSIVAKLLCAAGGNVAKAESGIVYIDEVDKLAKKGSRAGGSPERDVGGEGVQQCLLKLLEGKVVEVKYGSDTFKVDTTNVLFICGGAFEGMLPEKAKAARERGPIGFGCSAPEEGDEGKITTASLVKFGMLPEFVGRCPIFAQLEPLSESQLVEILTEPKGALVKQYQRLLAMSGAELVVTPGGLVAIAQVALARGTGARGLRGVMESLLVDAMFEAPGKEGSAYVLDEEAVAKGQARNEGSKKKATA